MDFSKLLYPTLKNLESKFQQNKISRLPYKNRIKNSIDLALRRRSDHSLQSLIQALSKEGIQTVLRRNKDGIIYGITYIDHLKKVVFYGRALGENYTAKAIQERCRQATGEHRQSELMPAAKRQILGSNGQAAQNGLHQSERLSPVGEGSLDTAGVIDTLLGQQSSDEYVPHELKKSNKKRKKKGQSIQ